MPQEKIPVLLDTDMGSDIDDAVCLAYLLNQPRCELVGITTVAGQSQRRAMLADAICRAAGQSAVPIFSGAEKPLLVDQRLRNASQTEILDRWPHRDDFEANRAVDFMREVIRKRPGEITLLTIGPLTNVGILFSLDPEIPGLLDRIVLMCGEFTIGKPEWNAMVDPHATSIVYGARVKEHISVGLDVTMQCRMSAVDARGVFPSAEKGNGRDELNIVRDAMEVFFEKRSQSQVIYHDPLAAAIIFEPNLCEWRDGRVEVYIDDYNLATMRLFVTDGDVKLHRVAVGVDDAGFLTHYTDTVKRRDAS